MQIRWSRQHAATTTTTSSDSATKAAAAKTRPKTATGKSNNNNNDNDRRHHRRCLATMRLARRGRGRPARLPLGFVWAARVLLRSPGSRADAQVSSRRPQSAPVESRWVELSKLAGGKLASRLAGRPELGANLIEFRLDGSARGQNNGPPSLARAKAGRPADCSAPPLLHWSCIGPDFFAIPSESHIRLQPAGWRKLRSLRALTSGSRGSREAKALLAQSGPAASLLGRPARGSHSVAARRLARLFWHKIIIKIEIKIMIISRLGSSWRRCWRKIAQAR